MQFWTLCLDVNQIWNNLLHQALFLKTLLGSQSSTCPSTPAQRKHIEKWQLRHDLVRQALFAYLPPAELRKVYLLMRFGSALQKNMEWLSDLKRAQANATSIYSLKKPKDAPMQSRVNQLTKLQQEVNYRREWPLSDVDVNLAFLQSPWQRLVHLSAVPWIQNSLHLTSYTLCRSTCFKPASPLHLQDHWQMHWIQSTNINPSLTIVHLKLFNSPLEERNVTMAEGMGIS